MDSLRSRCIGAVLSAFAVLVCALLFSTVSVTVAEAHAVHSVEAAQADVAAGAGSSAGSAALEGDCGVDCCSLVHCASGLVGGTGNVVLSAAAEDAFVSTRAIRAARFDQSTLKRPPRG